MDNDLVERLRAHAIEQTKSLSHLTEGGKPWENTLWWEAADALSRAPQSDTVTEEMVEAAARAIQNQALAEDGKPAISDQDWSAFQRSPTLREMVFGPARAALTAALAVRKKP